MASGLQTLLNEKEKFETRLRALPGSWYERVHSWSDSEKARLEQAIERILEAGVTSAAQLLQLVENSGLAPELRIAGLLVTGHLRPAEAGGVLVKALNEADEQIRLAASEALGLLGKRRLVWPLLSVFKNPASSDRLAKAAALNIGRLGTRNATRPFLETLTSSPDLERRLAAAKGLEMALNEGRLKDERLVEPLLTLLNDEAETLEIRCAVAGVLYWLKDGSARVVEPLLSLMNDPTRPLELREAATHALGGTRAEEAVAPLLTRLADTAEDSDLRFSASWALAIIGSPQAGPPLVDLLEKQAQAKTETSRIRAAVVNVLGWLYNPAAVIPLIARLDDQAEAVEVKAEAAQALGMIGDSRALKPLLSALHDEAPQIRYSAASGLGQLGDERAIAALEEVVAHDTGELPNYPGDYGKIRICAADAIDTIRQGGG